MSRKLIDRDALIASIPKTNVDIFENCRNCTTLCDWQVKELIDKMPTIDAVEVKHGEWISDYDGFEYDVRCSVCGEEALIKEGGSHDHAYSNYCSYCGAKMNGERRDDA